MKPEVNERARRRGRARRPLSETLARSSALFMVLQGLALLVILSGLILITVGMTASFGEFFTDLSARAAARREAEADIPVPLAAAWNRSGAMPSREPPAIVATGAAATMTAIAENGGAMAGAVSTEEAGFLPYQVSVDQMDQKAPAIPVTAPEPIIVTATPQPQPTDAPYIIEVTETPLPSPTPEPPGPPERLVIPIIALDAQVVPVYTQMVQLRGEIFEQWLAPDWYAAGWQQGSAQIGEQGNTVLNGHHNINGSVFSLLYQLIQGDEIFVYSGGREYRYVVSQVMNLQERGVPLEQRQENVRWVLPSTDERLTLVTCWPPESNTHRIIVVAVPVK